MKSRRVLMVATVPSMIGQFNMNNLMILKQQGFEVEVATNFKDNSVWPIERIKEFKKQMDSMGVKCYQIDFSRSAFSIINHIKAYNHLKHLFIDKDYSFIHTHTPIASAIVRLVASKTNVKVIYTAHGFHFYKGAPLKNWIVFYPIEKILSRYTDVLITINKEDYRRAKKRFNAKKTVYVPGVGVDTNRFKPNNKKREETRKELGVDENRIVLLSVGELNKNKNHKSVIKSIHNSNITYVIVGKGALSRELSDLANQSNVDLRLVGYKNNVEDYYNAADVYILPSIREGLNVSLMEAMASGLSVTCGNIRGNRDLIKYPIFAPKNCDEISRAINIAVAKKEFLGKHNINTIQKYSCGVVNKLMSSIYSEIYSR